MDHVALVPVSAQVHVHLTVVHVIWDAIMVVDINAQVVHQTVMAVVAVHPAVNQAVQTAARAPVKVAVKVLVQANV